ncbi:hypothetical protein C789_2002 [Microcystis aeruginosa FACHB-905 = DIANCHI905]|nr:hypothetical protein C789_2002 [Microcystis aeruginosa FACHB-905 = DIANCHI905]
MLKVVRSPPYQGGIKGGSPLLSAPPLSRGAGGIRGKIYLQFNYNYLLIYFSFYGVFV